MSEYLEEQLPHLRSLHTQLALPATSLAADQSRIETAIRNAITSIIRERETEVDDWKDAIGRTNRDVGCIARAVGDKGRNVIDRGRRESGEDNALPKQHERLLAQKEELMKVYSSRLQHIQKLQSTLNTLCNLLGPEFDLAKPPLLQPISSRTAPAKRSSGAGTLAQSIEDGKSEIYIDVGEEVTGELEAAVQRALEKRETRRSKLISLLRNLAWLHSELLLPPIPISHPHLFPTHLLPSRTTEEKPGIHVLYEKILAKFFSANPTLGGTLPEEDGEEEEVVEVNGLDGVEPEVGLIDWAEDVEELWSNEKADREARIQHLYDQLEPLWLRLEVSQDVMDLFVESNRGTGDGVINAYEAELERVLEIRRSSLSSFVISVRKEIEELSDELMMSDEEKAAFGGSIDDDYTEELLHEHEVEVARLKAEVESKSTILPKVREWATLVADEEELERNANNPNRFSARGGAMLREEKLRKRVGILKPRVEMDLLSLLPTWEEANGRPFLVGGKRVVEMIHDALEEKELAKEAKKGKSRYGTGIDRALVTSHDTVGQYAKTATSVHLCLVDAPTQTRSPDADPTVHDKQTTANDIAALHPIHQTALGPLNLCQPLWSLAHSDILHPLPVFFFDYAIHLRGIQFDILPLRAPDNDDDDEDTGKQIVEGWE
ncbi:Ase1/PRC1/MAP65 family protein, partial [Tremellales sp. Uapishka_1]